MKTAIYPGTFDPITYGHIDVLERAMELFDRVIITVARNSAKHPIFSDDERVEMIKEVVKKYGKRVAVDSFSGLLVEYAKTKEAIALVRGLRAVSDFEYEFQMALTNRKLAKKVMTVFLMPHEKYTYLNSSLVREIALHGGALKDFVPPMVERHLRRRVRDLQRRKYHIL
jgi:pantetheine-phosphate adenylyltransferase